MLGQATEETRLPELRQNLKLIRGGVDEEGARRWLVFDPSINKYFTLSRIGVDLMRAWQVDAPIGEFTARVQVAHPELEQDDVQAFIDFLTFNGLVVVSDSDGVDRLQRMTEKREQRWYKWLIHNYLFIRIPLLKPDQFLERFYPKISWLYQPWVAWAIFTVGLLGIALTLRQWDSFATGFSYFFSLAGLASYFVALVVVKVLHELGHAFTAYRQGCRVASIGVAFIVMFPILYTDTTDAWKLSSRYQKLKIVTAGIKIELYLALLATFIWAVLPDGIARSVAFVIASTTWISSLLVNISPFLRFDGYYAFSDILGSENLQSRSFAFGRWYLRELIFGWGLPAPEPLSYSRRRIFILYAWLTWIYRFFLFLGIALLVYYFAFKILGIILFVIEIVWFILLPISRELKVWWEMKRQIKLTRQLFISTALFLLVLASVMTPWQRSISLEAVLKYDNYAKVYPKEPGYVLQLNVAQGELIEAGQQLVELGSDELESQKKRAEIELQQLRERLERIASVEADKQQREVLEFAVARAEDSLESIEERLRLLRLTAPISGRVVEVAPLQAGQHVGIREPLFSIVDESGYSVIAYLPENQAGSIDVGASAQFFANSGKSLRAELQVKSIKKLGVTRLPHPELASIFGGNIAVRPGDEQSLVMEQTHYQLELEPLGSQTVAFDSRAVGVARVDAEPKSWITLLWTHISAVAVRELSF